MRDSAYFSEDQRDCLQEIFNVAMGQAGDSLARLLDVFVHLSIPHISTLSPEQLREGVRRLGGDSPVVSVVRQSFQTGQGQQGIRGEALMVFSADSCHDLAELLGHEGATPVDEGELLTDIANVLNGACLNGIAEQLEEEMHYSAPSILGVRLPVSDFLRMEAVEWKMALSVEINYRLENRSFHCDLLFLMPDASMDYLAAKLDELLA